MLDTTFIDLGTVCGSSTFLISFKLAVMESLTVRDESEVQNIEKGSP